MKLCFLAIFALSSSALAAPKPLFKSPLVNSDTPGHGVDITVDLKGAKELFLVVTDGGNGIASDWADWAEPRLVMVDGSEKKLTEVEWKKAIAGFGSVRVNSNCTGGELRSAGKAIPYGIGVHANSVIAYNLPDGVKAFHGRGVLDEGGTRQGNGRGTTVEFSVFVEDPGAIVASAAPGESSHEPADALKNLEVNPDLTVQLFASEPMMLSPSSIDIDARGRVWVCEVVNYRKHAGERAEGDRILILEDTDGDGKADKSTVFYQGHDVDSAHGICVLGNKALISCGDEVFWLIDDNNDGKADRKEVMFTKIGGAQHDHGIHAFHFGPDGRLYFNHGNAGKQLCDKNGNLITDIHGVKCTNQNNRPYQEGTIYRCDLDGGNVEMLAWNFRNNWEVSVDSFGTLWQSDNDDDGNKGVRINYVMEFGNYGYKDEATGAGWQSPRLGWEQEIPLRHWHLNDPGVVPNLLQTGAGSPTGMQVYEGDLLPSVFQGQPIHCDAGPNVVRGYITQPDGAGYKAEIVNVIEGTKDRWFRPSDVCTAPDGSLIVADWYDPGVGGHGMGDVTRGRLFRVTTKAALKYQMPNYKYDTVENAIAALKSPNESARYQAWQALKGFGDKATPALKALFDDKKQQPAHRARALWAVAQHSDVETAQSLLNTALTDSDFNIRITALRAACQLWQQKQPEKLRGFIAKAAKDESAAVRREAAIALRFDGNDAAAQIWLQLAEQTLPTDRWMIEALGIGDDLQGESRFTALMMSAKENIPAKGQLIWRHKGPATAPTIAAMITDSGNPQAAWAKDNSVRLLRALQLLPQTYGEAVAKAAETIFLKADSETALAAATLISRDAMAKNPEAKARLEAILKPIVGTAAFVSLVERLNLTGFEKELLGFIVVNPNAPESVTAAKLIAANRDGAARFIQESDAAQAKNLVAALGRVSDRAAVAVLGQQFSKEKRLDVRRSLLDALALSGEGGRLILRWNAEGALPAELKASAALALSRSTDGGLRDMAGRELPVPAALGAEKFPPLAELMKMKGDPAKGQNAFTMAGCIACHRVKGQFIDFGPDLSQIGNKLSKDGLFTAILYPSAAIEHSYGGLQITTKDGLTLTGYVVSDTDSELTLKIAGGASQAVKKSNIIKREEMKDSLMPPGLAATVGPQGLVDLVSWLQTLKL